MDARGPVLFTSIASDPVQLLQDLPLHHCVISSGNTVPHPLGPGVPFVFEVPISTVLIHSIFELLISRELTFSILLKSSNA